MSMKNAIIQDRIARQTGGRVIVIDSHIDGNFDPEDGGRWITWCDRHETFVQHKTRQDAVDWASEPKVWCGLCAEGMA